MEQALALDEPLGALKGRNTGHAQDQPPQVLSRHGGRLGVGDERPQDRLREPPQKSNGDHDDQPEEPRHALRLQAHEVLVSGPVGLRAERVEAGGQALDGDVVCDGGGHGCH